MRRRKPDRDIRDAIDARSRDFEESYNLVADRGMVPERLSASKYRLSSPTWIVTLYPGTQTVVVDPSSASRAPQIGPMPPRVQWTLLEAVRRLSTASPRVARRAAFG